MKTKRVLIIVMAFILIISLMGCASAKKGSSLDFTDNAETGGDVIESAEAAATQSAVQAGTVSVTGKSGYGSEGALLDQSLTLAEMLTYAIQDEYLARAEYAYIMETFGSRKPFSNIIRAEEKHIAELEPLFETYQVVLPEDDAKDRIAKVSGTAEALKAGETAEINNIAMYDVFLNQELPADIKAVFEELRKASVNHLEAFGRRH